MDDRQRSAAGCLQAGAATERGSRFGSLTTWTGADASIEPWSRHSRPAAESRTPANVHGPESVPTDQKVRRARYMPDGVAGPGHQRSAAVRAAQVTSGTRVSTDTHGFPNISSKLVMRVRFPSPAPPGRPRSGTRCSTWALCASSYESLVPDASADRLPSWATRHRRRDCVCASLLISAEAAGQGGTRPLALPAGLWDPRAPRWQHGNDGPVRAADYAPGRRCLQQRS
jgi:hypothetical protein